MPDPGPSWQPSDFNFDEDYKRLGLMEAIYTGSNPDLRAYKATGGKIISYQGWRDQSVVPLNVVDYYETVTKTMGGLDATQDFFRLFMIPGMNHCSGGAGAYAIDYLAYLEEWVEGDNAPDKLVGFHPANSGIDSFGTNLPLGDDEIAFSRPSFPYPLNAQYSGEGDPNDADNFVPVAP